MFSFSAMIYTTTLYVIINLSFLLPIVLNCGYNLCYILIETLLLLTLHNKKSSDSPFVLSPTERGHREGARVGATGSYRGQSQREGAGGAEGSIRTDQRDRPRKGAAQAGRGHPAFQSSYV